MKSPGENKRIIVFILSLAVCIFLAAPALALTADPMDLSVGARSQGMGRAYVAVAEDSESVFYNPAGLGTISTLKLGSMYSSVFDDLNYTVISGAYPMDNDSGTLGMGIINQSSTSIPLYSVEGTPEGTGSYGANTIFVSHGFDLSKKVMPYAKNWYGGYTLKYFMKSASGYGTTSLNGTGFAVDAGVLYKPKGFASYGISFQNLISGTMGYDKGVEDEIGSSTKLGTKIAILGDSSGGATLFQNDSKLDFAFDYDIGLRGKIPPSIHCGLEYKPQIGLNYIDKILTLRVGMNQVPTPDNVLSNLTMGLGLTYQGIEFNYAYTPSYGDLPQSSTQFFSISYVGITTPKKEIEEMKPLISQVNPSDKVVTTDDKLAVSGLVNEPSSVLKVEVNDVGVNVSPTGAFETNVALDVTGKHLITVRATDLKGRAEVHKIRVIRLVKFADVPETHWAVNPVQQLATEGLVEGYPDGSFQPGRALSRAELATLLVKAKGEEPPPVTGSVFKDVLGSHWASRYIKGALEMGLVTGYPDRTFKPNNKITRTEGVVVLTRFGELPEKETLDEGPYPDLTARFWASPLIASARESGLLDYIGEGDFQPKKELTRAEAVEVLSKTSYGSARIASLMDWSVGFEPGSRPAVAAIQPKEFADVTLDHWAAEPIKMVATVGLMDGYADGSFKPDRVVTRAELATILVKAKRTPVPRMFMSGYTDVPKNSGSASFIKAAVTAGYLTGRKGGIFEPNVAATRAEAVAAVVKFDNVGLPSELKRGPFPDMTAREWSSKYVAAAKGAGIIDYLKGSDFGADKPMTRAELAEILSKTTYGQAKINQIRSAGGFEVEPRM